MNICKVYMMPIQVTIRLLLLHEIIFYFGSEVGCNDKNVALSTCEISLLSRTRC